MKKVLSEAVLGKIVYKAEVDAPFDEVITALEKSVADNGFSVITTHDLKQTFQDKQLPLEEGFEYKIVQICNAQKSHKALTTMSYDLGIMMPKNIIVARENGVTTLRFMQMKPWMVSMMFPDIDIVPMSKNVMAIMKKIVHEAIDSVKK